MEFTAKFLLLLLIPVISANGACPSEEAVKPCTCSFSFDPRVECVGVKSIEDVRQAMKSLEGLRHVIIEFVLCQFEEPIPSDLFADVDVQLLTFTDCKLKGIGDPSRPAFEGLDHSLEELMVTNSFSESEGLKFLDLSNLEKLEEIEIDGNHIHTLGDDWFREGPITLDHVYFRSNNIKELGKNVFADLTEVRSIWLVDNEFSTLERSMFPTPAYLTSLDLSNNKISSLPEDIFTDMPDLTELVLDRNEIQLLPQTTWFPIWSTIHHVYLFENPLHCDNDTISWMFEMRRPYVLMGYCETPPEQKDKELKQLIDDQRPPGNDSSDDSHDYSDDSSDDDSHDDSDSDY